MHKIKEEVLLKVHIEKLSKNINFLGKILFEFPYHFCYGISGRIEAVMMMNYHPKLKWCLKPQIKK